MNEQDIVLSTVQYYALEGNYCHMRTSLLSLLKRFGSDPLLLFWRGFSMILEGRLIDGIRELTNLQDTPELLLCVPQLLKYAHRKCDTIDNDALKKLDELMKSAKSSVTNKDYYYAGVSMWLIGKYDRAREYIDKILKSSPQDKEALAIRGWIDLTCSKEALVKKSMKYFEDAFAINESTPLDAILGKIRYCYVKYNYSQALDTINLYSTRYPNFIPLYIEKINAQIAKLDWDGAVETAKRCLLIDSTCVQAASLLALEKCVHSGDMDEGAHLLGDVLVLLDQSEPKSHALYYTVAQTFSRIANGHSLLLQQTVTLMDRALSMHPKNYEYIVESGYQHYMAGNIDKAMKLFKTGVSADQTNNSASVGIIYCLLAKKQVKSASQQLEFLTEVVKDRGPSAAICYLNAIMLKLKGTNPERVIQLLNNAVTAHFTEVKGYPLGMKYVYLINPYFVMKIAECMMDYAPSGPSSVSEPSSNLLQCVAKVLAPLTIAVPGLLYIQLVLAKIKYLSGNFSGALSISQVCIDGSYKSIEAHLLQAVIHLYQNDMSLCAQSLEAALSSSFEVQQYSLYHIVKGRQQMACNKLEESRECLEMALSLKNSDSSPESVLLPSPSIGEWVSAYLCLSEVLNKLQLSHEATKIMQDAIEQFSGTPEEARITTANAELMISRGNVKEALNILSRVTEDKPFYIQAKERMADVYLNHEKDKAKYIVCYKELSERLPGPPTTQLLGDAYFNIQELELAIEVFEAAMRKSPKDGVLARKIGQAYLKSHCYLKAIQYYENSLKTNDVFSLRYDLACVYLRLKHFDKAERTAQKGLEQNSENTDESSECLRETVSYYRLLAKIYNSKDMTDTSIENLETAKSIQTQLVKRASMVTLDAVRNETKKLTEITIQLAKHYEQLPEGFSKAEECYQQILEVDEDCLEARMALIKLYLSAGDIQNSEDHCLSLMKQEQDNNYTALLMAELMVLKDNPLGAAKHMEDVLIKQSDHYECLTRLIDIKRRLGDLKSVKYYITKAESYSAQSVYEPKLTFCKGLYCRYMVQTEDALLLFNQIRNDPTCGEDALFNMVEMCLLNDDIMGMESLKNTESDNSTDAELMAIRTAEKLLKELNPSKPSSVLRVKVLENFMLLSTKSRTQAEKVLLNIQDMSNIDRENPSVLLLSATAYVLMKQIPRARNQLKRLSKLPWTVQYGEDLERGWILLADVYMQSGKYDLAIEQLKRCLKYNKSSSKASECLGYISEREHAYEDAGGHYKNAWTNSHMNNPVVGYRLAFNLLKAHQYTMAVDVCHQVLEKHSEYPRIKKDIMDKARQSIRN